MNLLSVSLVICAFLWRSGDCVSETRLPFYRYKSEVDGHHFYTTNVDETKAGRITDIGVVNANGYINQGNLGYLASEAGDSLEPLYRFYRSESNDYFYTRWDDTTGKDGYVYEGIAGYVSGEAVDYMVPYYRWWNPETKDHLYTLTANVEPLEVGYRGGKIGGYVFSEKEVTVTVRPTNTPRPTVSPRPTVAPRTTNTPRPGNTPRPTNTGRPTGLGAQGAMAVNGNLQTPPMPAANPPAPTSKYPFLNTNVIVGCLVVINALFVVVMVALCCHLRRANQQSSSPKERVRYGKVFDSSSAGQTSDSNSSAVENPLVIYK